MAPSSESQQQRTSDDHRHGDASSLFLFISAAAVTLVKAIIEPTDRSMPPAMTTIAWATAAKGHRQSRLWLSDSTSAAPYVGWIVRVNTSSTPRTHE